MSDYKELIERIRQSAQSRKHFCISRGTSITPHYIRFMFEAADAIEQLCTDVARLEAENRAKEQYIAETIGKVIKERDAAIADLTLVGSCVICKHQDYFYHGVRCGDVKCRFEWRGVQEAEDGNR